MIKFIDVICLIKSDGTVTPLTIFWEDGRRFEIDKIIDKKRCASTKGGGKGIRYICRILGKEKHLFFDHDLWWVEID